MSVLTVIDGIPLFTTIDQALAWGQNYNIVGYHTHSYQGQIGYMSGNNHGDITTALTALGIIQPTANQPNTIVNIPQASGSSGGTGGGGGGY
tara:strand:- start:173 stop:448 length:276 start_codon:yes stop_codon:yes gene_type:complete